jgi:hypothetical protein
MTSAGSITLKDEVTITEVRVRLASDLERACGNCFGINASATPDENGVIDYCIFDERGITGPAVIGTCESHEGSLAGGPGEVVYARGSNFEPIDLPTVVAE